MSQWPANKRRTTYQHMIAGTLWALAMRWSVRGLGIISIAVLARLLTPADFGIMAMASLLIGLIDGFVEMGTEIPLLRRPEITRADCDTAWTLRLIQGAVVALALLLCARFAASYFSEPRLPAVIMVMAGCSLIGGAANISVTLVRRELDFAKDFRYGVYGKLVTFLATLAFAVWLRDYRGLVLGYAAGTLGTVALSYRMHPYRPRPSLERADQYLTLSISVIAVNVARFLKAKVDVLVIGGRTGSALLGSYNVASELAATATQEVVIPVWRGLFPTFSRITGDHEQFIAAYGHFLGAMAIVCLPLGLGLFAVADDAVALLLGAQWTAAVAPLKWLAVASALVAMIDVLSGNILFVSGHEKRAAVMIWVHLAVLVLLVMVAGRSGSIGAVAMAVAAAAALVLPVAAMVLIRSIRFPPAMMWRALWRPVLAVGAMVVVLAAFPALPDLPVAMRLVTKVLLGAAVYLLSLATLWILAGRPHGPESVVWTAARGALARGPR